MEIKFAPSQIAKNNTMSYSSIHEKLENKKTIILDGGMGAELEKNGAKMDEKMWCGKCSVDNPELVRKIHEDYINAGADVITTNTYSTTPISMRQYGYEDSIEDFNRKSVQVAKEAIKNLNKDVALAGSVSTFGNFYKLGVKAMIPGFDEQLKILSKQGKIAFVDNEKESDVIKIAKNAYEQSYNIGSDTLIIDTAGRLQIDDQMIEELKKIKSSINIHETLLVIDSMIGQEALNVANTFNKEIGIDGLILTKLDADA